MLAAAQSTATSTSRSSPVQAANLHGRQQNAAYLRPEDAIAIQSPPRRTMQQPGGFLGRNDTVTATTAGQSEARKRREKRRGRSGSRRRKTMWKKLLWVKQSYPDNYTDEETFLDHLQWNPRFRPYEFWTLFADSTIIVQHLCSVVIFVCCFTAIFQERVSPQTVVQWATIGTAAGWILRDFWQSRADQSSNDPLDLSSAGGEDASASASIATASTSTSAGADFGMPFKEPHSPLCGPTDPPGTSHSRNQSSSSNGTANLNMDGPNSANVSAMPPTAPYSNPNSPFSPRMQERLTTLKSAVLIYFFLLGLSPILKSLTKSTSSDSIWALSSWLMGINVFTFDYGAGPESKFPASLSTNAALMASTVLASRLPSTTHVFSLTLFSIEVFGLFPVFRRHLRHHSWTGHLWLTAFLVTFASSGLSMTISGGGWGMGMLGAVLGSVITSLSMGLTSWWLIGLQRYKNEIHGPWDPARPVIRRHWD